MTPEQISEAQLHFANLQLWVTGLAIFLGPLSGVLFTFWFQSRKERNQAKHSLFIALMANRKINPPHFDLVRGLNIIDAVFAKNQEVKNLWHQYYDLLCQIPLNEHLSEAKYLDLLSAIAKDLGYKNISQTDIARFYTPQAYGNQWQLNVQLQLELLRVLKATGQLPIVPQINQP